MPTDASEMIGAVKGIYPETGLPYDDTKRYIEASTILSAQDKHKVYEATPAACSRGSMRPESERQVT